MVVEEEEEEEIEEVEEVEVDDEFPSFLSSFEGKRHSGSRIGLSVVQSPYHSKAASPRALKKPSQNSSERNSSAEEGTRPAKSEEVEEVAAVEEASQRLPPAPAAATAAPVVAPRLPLALPLGAIV